MSKSILLHIGSPKTGTTSIQRWLSDAQGSGYLAKGCYPLWEGDHNQQRLVSLYLSYDELPPASQVLYGSNIRRYESMRDRYRRFLFKRFRDVDKAIISAESLSGPFSSKLATGLKSDLKSLGFDEFHVLYYVRDPADYFLSMMQQDLKSSRKPPFIEDPKTFKYEFLKRAENWENAFPGRLIVRNFSNDARFDIVKDFTEVLQRCLGVELPWAPLKENTSISAEGMKILQDYREAFWPDSSIRTPDVNRLVQFLVNSKQYTLQTKPTLIKEFVDVIRTNHEDDAKALYYRYGVDLGLEAATSANVPSPRGESYRVDEIVDSVDGKIINRLLLCLAKEEMVSTQKLLSVGRNAYARIPSVLRPKLFKNWLRRRLMEYLQRTLN
jgi:hypothetical protein